MKNLSIKSLLLVGTIASSTHGADVLDYRNSLNMFGNSPNFMHYQKPLRDHCQQPSPNQPVQPVKSVSGNALFAFPGTAETFVSPEIAMVNMATCNAQALTLKTMNPVLSALYSSLANEWGVLCQNLPRALAASKSLRVRQIQKISQNNDKFLSIASLISEIENKVNIQKTRINTSTVTPASTVSRPVGTSSPSWSYEKGIVSQTATSSFGKVQQPTSNTLVSASLTQGNTSSFQKGAYKLWEEKSAGVLEIYKHSARGGDQTAIKHILENGWIQVNHPALYAEFKDKASIAPKVTAAVQVANAAEKIAANDIQPFMQQSHNNACQLYSVLFAMYQVPQLKQELVNRFEESSTHLTYRFGDKKIQINKTEIKKDENLNPSSNMYVNGFGRALMEHVKKGEFSYLADDQSYTLVNMNSQDFIFNKAASWIRCSTDAAFSNSDGKIYLPNGTTVDLTKRILSTSVKAYGHAVSIYYDQAQKKFKYFDNQQGVKDLTPQILAGLRPDMTIMG